MSGFGWISLLIIGLAFLVPIRMLIRAKLEGADISLRSLMTPPWKWPGWTWTFPPEDDDPFHDTKIVMVLGGIMVGLATTMIVLLTLGTLALKAHLTWLGYPLLLLTLLVCLAALVFVGIRLWVDFGRPFKRWLARRRA